ncbi:MAG TPA: 3D-(3,5/4)-trihydroxycyclohexane-1,2-dione acylhydrolase (decyclizing), partial [Aestuariivirga sp.]|nr:3D-(3,5/4)-trihydroxycyclohexane-1,2-dione acylhydrolase (decyclizing) [Aestuariivirga sp.]
MAAQSRTIRLTMAQALVRHLANQFIVIDGVKQRLCGGGFGIFGHGNVICLGEALQEFRHELPLWRGQNEQSMALAAVAYAKQKLRQRFMFATASAGPGTTNMVTAAAVAHTNRLPILFLCGDTYVSRLPDPVLQQVEHYGDPSISVNDAFKSVSRYWDRITHPAQIIQSLPKAISTMLDPADCGPAFLGLPQDVQGWSYDYPEEFFAERIHHIRRQSPDVREVEAAANMLRSAQRPLIIAGGGVQYSGATEQLRAFAEAHNIPVVETIAGRANLLHGHALNIGPIGVTGSNSANAVAAAADCILAVGTRLQDFTTGSWTAFDRDARIISINVARFDATKHMALPVVGDARLSLAQLTTALGGYRGADAWSAEADAARKAWDGYVDENVAPTTKAGANRPMSYAQVIGAINTLCHPRDRIVAAAGGLPAEVAANWRTLSTGSVDVEFGYSCMGYEIAGGWGARIAQMETEPERDTIIFTGDGSYLMMNSDIYSSVLSGRKLIIIVCDNGGFAVINKLQTNTGNVPFNNLIADCNIESAPFAIDFPAHARAMGAHAEDVHSVDELRQAFVRAQAAKSTCVICLKVDAFEGWTMEGHTWWEIGTPSVSNRADVTKSHEEVERGRARQRAGI